MVKPQKIVNTADKVYYCIEKNNGTSPPLWWEELSNQWKLNIHESTKYEDKLIGLTRMFDFIDKSQISVTEHMDM